jgi:hypothetical protein
VQNIDPYTRFTCELPVTGNVYRAECILSDAESHFCPNQKNSSFCILLNVCITNREQIASNVRISTEKRSTGLGRIGLILKGNNICAPVWKFGT